MIVYQSTKTGFLRDALQHDIHDIVGAAYTERTGRRVGPSEFSAWKESLIYMAKVLADEGIPEDSGVAIEYGIPGSGKRVDFILSGFGQDRGPAVVVVELKRWSKAKKTDKDAVVRTALGGSEQETPHPSYQAWSYAALLQGFNEAVYEGGMQLRPCAYLHNYPAVGELNDKFYDHYLEKAPLFLKGDSERTRLREFIKKYVRHGDNATLVYQIENGRIRPSKMLADSLDRMMKGNQEFVLIDDQKLVFESTLALVRGAATDGKSVMIVKGGPGTGKSVVAINLLVAVSRLRLVGRYVSKNAAPRTVYESRLTGTMRRTEISNLFSGSGVFTDTEANSFDVLIVDEAHRLNEKSGLYQNLGENQVKELISSAKCTIFFIDEDQRVTLKDIGTEGEIRKWAGELGARVDTAKLESQFRCGGSDGYLAWLDEVLGISSTANTSLEGTGFDFKVVDSPSELRRMIRSANEASNKARMVAGYCWNWISKRDARAHDISFPEHDFSAQWNLSRDGSLWIVAPDSVEEIGCIHTCQGLEVDYIGVIVGPDFVVRDGKVVTVPERRARTDKSISGFKKMLKADPKRARIEADRIIKNTYRTLMTRGMKGCYLYCTDPETAEYFRSRVGRPVLVPRARRMPVRRVREPVAEYDAMVVPFRRVRRKETRPYTEAVPIFDLKIAAGQMAKSFSNAHSDMPDHDDWAILPDEFRPRRGLFVAQVVGESMNRRIPNGAWCLFKVDPVGTRNGKVVLAQHKSIDDPETGGSYTVKVYHSTKTALPDGTWRHKEIRLQPDSSDSTFRDLVFGPESAGDLRIVAELISVL